MTTYIWRITSHCPAPCSWRCSTSSTLQWPTNRASHTHNNNVPPANQCSLSFRHADTDCVHDAAHPYHHTQQVGLIGRAIVRSNHEAQIFATLPLIQVKAKNHGTFVDRVSSLSCVSTQSTTPRHSSAFKRSCMSSWSTS